MRKLRKITTCLIVMCMVATMLPAKTAWAARGRVELGESLATTSKEFVLEIGETKDLNFYGATGYVYKTDKKSVFWKTTNSNIVSVDTNGVIKGIAPGTATVSMTVTTAKTKTSYEGSAVVTVKAKNTVDVHQVSYEKVTLTYATEEAALEAYRKGITLKRVRQFSYGTTYYNNVVPKVAIDFYDRKTINVETAFNNGGEYILYAEGLDAAGYRMTIVWDTTAAYAELTYENAYLSEKGGRDITGTKSLSYCDATPNFKLYDKNDIIIGYASDGNIFVGASGVTGNLRYVKKYSTGSASLRSTGTGVVRLSSLSQSATMYAVWTSGDKTNVVTTPDVLVEPREYIKPDLGAFVEGIVATNDKGDDVSWTNSETWQGSVPAETTTNILYYFLASDGKKYSGNSDAYAATDINPLSTEYRFVFELDSESSKIASITKSGRLTTYKTGDVIVYIYQCEPGRNYVTPNAEIVGQFNVTITDAPELFDIEIKDYVTTVSAAEDNLSDVKVEFTLIDQYGEPFKINSTNRSKLKLKAQDTAYNSTITASGYGIVWNSSNNGGYFRINLAGKTAGMGFKYDVLYDDVIDESIDVILY